MNIEDFKNGLREKNPKTWLILGAILVAFALISRLLLVAGIVIIGIFAYTWYKGRK